MNLENSRKIIFIFFLSLALTMLILIIYHNQIDEPVLSSTHIIILIIVLPLLNFLFFFMARVIRVVSIVPKQSVTLLTVREIPLLRIDLITIIGSRLLSEYALFLTVHDTNFSIITMLFFVWVATFPDTLLEKFYTRKLTRVMQPKLEFQNLSISGEEPVIVS